MITINFFIKELIIIFLIYILTILSNKINPITKILFLYFIFSAYRLGVHFTKVNITSNEE